MEKMYERIEEAASYIRSRIEIIPGVGMILGSGLGSLVEGMENRVSISYAEIPHFPSSTVSGHAGRLSFGLLHSRAVAAMEGRPHYYEGCTMKQVAFPVYLLKMLGVQTLMVTNACGGINTSFEPGTLMIIDDFINLTADNPLIGPNDDRLGPRFPDMTEPYSRKLIDLARDCAAKLGITPAQGVYAGFPGPYFETAAEIRAYGGMGADAVGMSTVPETIAANHAGLSVLGISCITNMATGIRKTRHSHEKVLATAKAASGKLSLWLAEILRSLPA